MLNAFLPLAILVASPPSNSSAGATRPVVKINPLDKIICRTEEGSGGRLDRKKICMSVRDWQDMALENRQATERLQLMGQNVPK